MGKFIQLMTKTILPLLLIPILAVQTSGQPLPIQFDQAQNGKASSFPITWTNGILNATHTTYYEGVSTPQRLFLWNLDQTNDGTANHHTVKIRHLAEASGLHAYDFVTSWSQAVAEAQNIGGSVNEFGAAGANLYNAQLDDAPSEFTGANAGFFDHAAFTNAGNAKHKTATFSTTSFGTPSGTVGSTDDVLACWVGVYQAPFFEIAGNQDITSFSVTAEPGYVAGYKIYTLTWSSASDRVLILFAGHPAVGQTSASPICGYGTGQGAGSVSGGSYHIKLDYRDGNIGERDNQVMAGTFIIPPTCGLDNGTVGCRETTSFTFQFSSTNAPNATIKFYFVSNSAGARLPNATTATGDCSSNNYQTTTDASGNASITITPSGSLFTAGGSFRLGACVTTTGGSSTCVQENATTIEAPSVVAKANGQSTTCATAYELNTNQANPQVALTAVGSIGATQDNTLFSSFVWSLPTALEVPCGVNNGTLSNLSGTSGDNITFTPTTALGGGYVAGIYAFKVTATTGDGCVATALVFINASGGASCPGITGPTTACANQATQLTFRTSDNSTSPGAYLHYDWYVAGSLVASDVGSINVTVGANSFTVQLKIRADNGQVFEFSTCVVNVTVNPVPVCNITGDNPVCEMSTHTYTSAVTPTGGTVTHSWSITGNGAINGAANGPTVSVTSGSINNGTSFTLRDDITRNGCSSYCTKVVTVQDCGSGCTIGFWKTHPEVWNGTCSLPPKSKEKTDIVGLQFYTCTKFATYMGFAISGITANSTMLDVLALSGGNCQTVARQGVGALLNAIAFSDYPYPAGVSNYTDLKAVITAVLTNVGDKKGYDCASLAIALNDANNHEVFDENGLSVCSGLPITQTLLPAITFRVPPTDQQQLAPDKLSVQTYPNPFSSTVSFNISSAANGKARLEIFDMLGRRLALVYEGNLDAGTQKTVLYKVKSQQMIPMIYKLTVGNQSVYGKLLPSKK
jgi:hypothetical protein